MGKRDVAKPTASNQANQAAAEQSVIRRGEKEKASDLLVIGRMTIQDNNKGVII